MMQKETLPPDMIVDMVPLCMDSVRCMLGSCRVPGLDVDTLTIASNSRHVVVIRSVTPTKFTVFPVAVWQKVVTGAKFFFKFIFVFHDMPCDITQQLIKYRSGRPSGSRENQSEDTAAELTRC